MADRLTKPGLKLAGNDMLAIEHWPEEPAQVEILPREPKPHVDEAPIEPEEPDDGVVFLVRSAGFQRRRSRPPN